MWFYFIFASYSKSEKCNLRLILHRLVTIIVLLLFCTQCLTLASMAVSVMLLVGAGHDQGNSGGQWPNPVSSVFMPKTDVTMVEGREAGQKASSGQSARLSGQWPADESRQMTASGNVQPTGMRREWSPGEDRLPSDTSRQWSAPGNAQPVSANRQWSANENRQCSAPENAHLASASRQWSAPGSAQPANESRQWSAPENAQPANEGRQWSAPENAHPVSTNRQWSAPGNAQLANENRQRSAPIGGQSNHTSDQWHVKENGPSTHETRQWSARDRDYSSSGDQQGRREDRENGFGPQGNPHHSDPYNSTQEPGRSRAQLSNHGPSVVAPKVEPAAASRGGYRLIAKHNYTVNPNSPLGPGAELGFKQAEQLTKIGVHPEQELWWRAKNENGDVGYVPSTYMMVSAFRAYTATA